MPSVRTALAVASLGRRALIGRAVAALVVAMTAAGLAGPAVAATSTSGAQSFLETFTKRGLGIFGDQSLDTAAKRTKVRSMIDEGFDVEAIARDVLSRHYKGLTDPQRAEYHALYTDYVLATYFKQLVDFGNLNLAFLETNAAQNGDALVNTRADRPSGKPLRLQWRVRADDAGRFRIVDIIAEGVSIAVTQRSDFNAVMANKGFDGLIAALQQKIKETEVK